MPSTISNPWEVLGLEGPTDDLKAIKKAYAAKLKTTRPEDDPEGFMLLRWAFDSVTRRDPEPYFETPAPNIPRPKSVEPDIKESEEFGDFGTESAAQRLPVYFEQIRSGIEAILSNPVKRSNLRAWEQYFNQDYFDKMDHQLALPPIMLECLMDFMGVFEGASLKTSRKQARKEIGRDAGAYIFEQMGWSDIIERSYEDNTNFDIRWLAQIFGIGVETRDAKKVKRSIIWDLSIFLFFLIGFLFWARGFVSTFDTQHLLSYYVGGSIGAFIVLSVYLIWNIFKRSTRKVTDSQIQETEYSDRRGV